MDINDIRVAVTLSSLVLFVALVAHTWSRKRKSDHEEAALLPFTGEVGEPQVPGRQGEMK